MFFQVGTSPESITAWVKAQVAALGPDVKYGWDVEVRPHKKPRTYQQNRLLMLIMQEMVKFYHRTGYVVPGLCGYVMRTDVLKEYWKGRYGVGETHRMSTAEFGKFIDWIQATMVEETHGEWEIITTEQANALVDGWY